MNIEDLRDYCLSKPGVEESFPFDSETLVFKVNGKAFLLTGLGSSPMRFNVKCDPELAVELRENYSCVLPGWHMNKKHWNTIIVDGTVPVKLLLEWIDHSYALVAARSPKKKSPVKKKVAAKKKAAPAKKRTVKKAAAKKNVTAKKKTTPAKKRTVKKAATNKAGKRR